MKGFFIQKDMVAKNNKPKDYFVELDPTRDQKQIQSVPWQALTDKRDQLFVENIVKIICTELENVDVYAGENIDENRDGGDCNIIPIQERTAYYVLKIINIKRSAINLVILEKFVSLNPNLIKEINFIINDKHPTNNSTDVFNIELFIFYENTSIDYRMNNVFTFEYKMFIETNAKENYMQLYKLYRLNPIDFPDLDGLPQAFEKHVDIIADVIHDIYNSDFKIPALDIDLKYDKTHEEYNLIINNIFKITYSFLEYFNDKFCDNVKKVKVVENIGEKCVSLSIIIHFKKDLTKKKEFTRRGFSQREETILRGSINKRKQSETHGQNKKQKN